MTESGFHALAHGTFEYVKGLDLGAPLKTSERAANPIATMGKSFAARESRSARRSNKNHVLAGAGEIAELVFEH
jgi:hypothetical protein